LANFGAIEESRRSYRFVFYNNRAFFGMCAPWIVLSAVIGFSIDYIFSKNFEHHSISENAAVGVLLSSWLATLTCPLFMLAWHRFVLLGELPKWGISVPLRSYWSFFWRWGLFLIIYRTIGGFVSGYITSDIVFIGQINAQTLSSIIQFILILCLLTVSADAGVLNLPAIATDDKAASLSILTSTRQLGAHFALGLPISGTLYAAAGLLPSPDHLGGAYATLELAALCLLSSTMQFLGFAVFSTYLCRSFVASHPSYGNARLNI
jgi:hypothetical protein